MWWLLISRLALADPSVVRAEGAVLTVGESIRIEAPVSTLDLAKGTASFSGGVTLSQGELGLTCDTLQVFMGEEGERFERAEARGSVLVTRGAARATGAKAVLVGSELVLTGSPTLQQGQHRMAGERIVFEASTVRCFSCSVEVGLTESQP